MMPSSSHPLLSIRDLKIHISMGNSLVKAVDGVTLDLTPGEIVALVGESGCGKTTLALSVGRLLPERAKIVAGAVWFHGKDLVRLSESEMVSLRGRRIAYIFQDPATALNPVLSIEEQLVETIQLHQKRPYSFARRQAIELLDRLQVKLPEMRLRQYPHQLSGGLRQRVVMAMALAGAPEVLVADEPTTALDVVTQQGIFNLLSTLKRENDLSILLITHDARSILPIADRMAIMQAGRIVESGQARDLYQNPQHPYTQALIRCIPQIGKGRQSFHAG